MQRRAVLKAGKPLARRTPLVARTPLKTTGRLAHVSPTKVAALKAAGKPVRRSKPGRYTGPSRSVVTQVWKRCGGMCEFPACGHPANDVHHRYERGAGGTGRKSAAAPWINQPANLLGACRHHNDWASNQQPREAERIGWLLRDAERPAVTEPVLTRHDPLPVWLDNEGGWHRFEEACA